MTDTVQTDNESLNPKPGYWVVGDKEYRIKPAKLRHVAAIMKIQASFEPLQKFAPDADAEKAIGELSDDELAKIKSADKDFEEMIVELAEGLTPEALDEIGFEDRINGIGIVAKSMEPADAKGLEKIGATPSKKKTETKSA